MKSKEIFKSALKVEIPKYNYRFEKRDKTDTNPIELEINEDISKKIEEIHKFFPEYVPADYTPDKYDFFKKQESTILTLNIEEGKMSLLKNKIKSLLKEPRKARGITKTEIEEQLNHLLYTLNKYNPNKLKQRYREGIRKDIIDFYKKMGPFVMGKSKAIDKAESIIKIKINSNNKSQFREYKLPLSLKGNQHFLDAFSSFLYSYYHNNPTCRSVYAYTDEFILEKHKTLLKEKNYLKQDVIDDARLSLHITVLNIIKDFPQFPPSKRPNSTLTEDQGRFIVQFLHLMGYNNKYRRIELDDPLNLNQDIKTLRDELRALLNNLKNTPSTVL